VAEKGVLGGKNRGNPRLRAARLVLLVRKKKIAYLGGGGRCSANTARRGEKGGTREKEYSKKRREDISASKVRKGKKLSGKNRITKDGSRGEIGWFTKMGEKFYAEKVERRSGKERRGLLHL